MTKRVFVWRVGAILAGLAAGPSLAPPSAPSLEVAFERHALVDDDTFRDAHALSADDLEVFLRATPHGSASVLATVDADDGRSAAEILVRESRRAGVNPLLLLAKLQVEQSLVSRRSAGPRAIDYALGCECPDGQACRSRSRGFGPQVRCAAEKLATYFRELSHRGASRSLWRVGAVRPAACGALVAPRNRATASLYTYTPFVLEGRGGNWLFHRVFRRYAHYLGVYPDAKR